MMTRWQKMAGVFKDGTKWLLAIEAMAFATLYIGIVFFDLGARFELIVTDCPKVQDAYRIELREVELTAYCPCEICCGEYADGVTASGVSVDYNGGRILAAPASFPFGTLIYVEGEGMLEVQDRGGSIQGNRLDVFKRTHEEALEFGRKVETVSIFWDRDPSPVGAVVD